MADCKKFYENSVTGIRGDTRLLERSLARTFILGWIGYSLCKSVAILFCYPVFIICIKFFERGGGEIFFKKVFPQYQKCYE